MRAHFAPDPSGDAWFRVGRIDVTTTVVAVALGALGMLAWVVVPALPMWLAYRADLLLAGQVWRAVTWPLADSVSLWGLLSLLMLWYFGRDLEATLGRRRMAWLLVAVWASLTLASTLVGLVLPGALLAGMGLIQFAVLLLWIAEYPQRRFLFNIPAWVFGAVVVALQVLTMLGTRAWASLFSLVLGMALVAVAARSVGLLTDYAWIPGRRVTVAPRSTRATTPSRRRAASSSDEEQMDALLAKISANGLHSLSRGERAKLDRLRQRRSGPQAPAQ